MPYTLRESECTSQREHSKDIQSHVKTEEEADDAAREENKRPLQVLAHDRPFLARVMGLLKMRVTLDGFLR